MRRRTADLIGPELDLAAAMACGATDAGIERYAGRAECWATVDSFERVPFVPSSRWSDGGPILEREWINLEVIRSRPVEWLADFDVDADGNREGGVTGPTMLVAGLRAFVLGKLGAEVELPDEPMNPQEAP